MKFGRVLSLLVFAGAVAAISSLVLAATGTSFVDVKDIFLILRYYGPEVLNNPGLFSEYGLLTGMLIWMVLIAIVISVIRAAVYLHLMSHLIFASLSLTEIEEFAAVARSPAAAPRFGEGLADALDVGEIGF